MTRGRAHPLSVEEPAITVTVADTYLLDSQPTATMIDSSATHSFVSRYSFFRSLYICSFVLTHSVTVWDVVSCNWLGQWLPRLRITAWFISPMFIGLLSYFLDLNFLLILFPQFLSFSWNYDVMLLLVLSMDDYFIFVVLWYTILNCWNSRVCIV